MIFPIFLLRFAINININCSIHNQLITIIGKKADIPINKQALLYLSSPSLNDTSQYLENYLIIKQDKNKRFEMDYVNTLSVQWGIVKQQAFDDKRIIINFLTNLTHKKDKSIYDNGIIKLNTLSSNIKEIFGCYDKYVKLLENNYSQPILGHKK